MILGKQGSPLASVTLVDIGATGSVLGIGRIDVRSPRLDESSLSPRVQLNADGAIDFGGDILATSGCQGGNVSVQSLAGPLSLGFVDVSARGCPSQSGEGLAGSVLVSTAGEGHLVDRIVARSRAYGGLVTLSADALFLAGKIDARGTRRLRRERPCERGRRHHGGRRRYPCRRS